MFLKRTSLHRLRVEGTCMKNMNKPYFQNILGLLLLGLGKRDLCAQNIESRTHVAVRSLRWPYGVGTPENDTRKLQGL